MYLIFNIIYLIKLKKHKYTKQKSLLYFISPRGFLTPTIF
nr:MAG TPA: hypothetical protein [Caudoviricetes sp.]